MAGILSVRHSTTSRNMAAIAVQQGAATLSNMMNPTRLALAAQTLLLCLAATGCAFPGRGEPPRGGEFHRADKPHGPPPEAVAACKGKTEGAAASFAGRDGENIAGVCELVDGVLAIRPPAGKRPPPPPRD
jgi:hypothetical protein